MQIVHINEIAIISTWVYTPGCIPSFRSNFFCKKDVNDDYLSPYSVEMNSIYNLSSDCFCYLAWPKTSIMKKSRLKAVIIFIQTLGLIESCEVFKFCFGIVVIDDNLEAPNAVITTCGLKLFDTKRLYSVKIFSSFIYGIQVIITST